MIAKSIEELVSLVEAEGIVVAKLQDLRLMAGYKRLGTRVLSELSQTLKSHSLGYFPAHVLDNNESPRASDEVRIVGQQSNIGKIVHAIQNPTEANDKFLHEVSSTDDALATETLEAIRTLLDG